MFKRFGSSELYFQDRVDAGTRLAARLGHLKDEDVVVLGLPRGGVPVGHEVAKTLKAPLDVIVVRKLGVPWQPELAMGAIGEDDIRVLNREVIEPLGLTEADIRRVEQAERQELARRVNSFREGRSMVDLAGKTALIIDDGIATGATARAACQVARAHGAKRIVMAAPVASASAAEDLEAYADEVVCLGTPERFGAIGAFYRDFSPTDDGEVREILGRASQPANTGPVPTGEVAIGLSRITLPGHLVLPGGAGSIVLFAHGSGSSRHSPRNQKVATALNRAGFGTLLFDLLTEREGADRRNVFDIGLLAERLAATTRWLTGEAGHTGGIGYFGASTGAAAALLAAAELGEEIGAVVSRGGRPDLARPRLGDVVSPTLLIVGDRDTEVLALNRQAAALLNCPNEVSLVPGATHLFEEPGALERVAELAGDWFDRHLN